MLYFGESCELAIFSFIFWQPAGCLLYFRKPDMDKAKRPVGRPSKLNQTHLDGAEWYLKGGFQERGEVIPSIAGLACFFGVSRDQIYDWGKQNTDFRYTLENIKAAQENILLNKGLQGEFNATITKLALSNHGYSDKVETDVKNSDGSLKSQFSAAEVKAALAAAAEKV